MESRRGDTQDYEVEEAPETSIDKNKGVIDVHRVDSTRGPGWVLVQHPFGICQIPLGESSVDGHQIQD